MNIDLSLREQRTLSKIERNNEGSKLLLQLFHKGYRNVSAVQSLLMLHLPKYKTAKYQKDFKEFWLGVVRYQEMINDLAMVVDRVNQIESEQNEPTN